MFCFFSCWQFLQFCFLHGAICVLQRVHASCKYHTNVILFQALACKHTDTKFGSHAVNREGRLVHIDFGFILETSPGGNMRFESAQFKLSHEMTQLLDPSGVMKSETWNRFVRYTFLPCCGQ